MNKEREEVELSKAEINYEAGTKCNEIQFAIAILRNDGFIRIGRTHSNGTGVDFSEFRSEFCSCF